jgi:LysR family hydrogen peroxide-inducible transcriptional activator
LEGGSLETIRYMVASGVGVTIVPATAACAEKYSQRLITIRRFDGSAPKRRIALTWRKGFARKAVIDLLADAIAACNLSCVKMFDRTASATEVEPVAEVI